MGHGMILDTAHMSDKSVNDAYVVLGERPGYPAVISHAHFRQEGMYAPVCKEGRQDLQCEIAEYMASEYDISDSNLEKVKNAGGVVGPFMHQARIGHGVHPGGVPAVRGACLRRIQVIGARPDRARQASGAVPPARSEGPGRL